MAQETVITTGDGGGQHRRLGALARQERKGPAPFASVEDISSLASFEGILSPVPVANSASSILSAADEEKRNDDLSSIGGSFEADFILQRSTDDTLDQEPCSLQSQRDLLSLTSGYFESYPCEDILQPACDFEMESTTASSSMAGNSNHNRENKNKEKLAPMSSSKWLGHSPRGYNFRMIDASATDLRDPIDRTRHFSEPSSCMLSTEGTTSPEVPTTTTTTSSSKLARHQKGGRLSSVCSEPAVPSGSNLFGAIETSFCGLTPPHQPATPAKQQDQPQRLRRLGSSASNEALASTTAKPLDSPCSLDEDRNLYDEIHQRMQFPLTKQDSYANAIYSVALRRNGGVRKQDSYEQAISGQFRGPTSTPVVRGIKKQDSYNKAIGGSFEDNSSYLRSLYSRSCRIIKQESYLKAVGEISPENEASGPFAESTPSIVKQESYVSAVVQGSLVSRENLRSEEAGSASPGSQKARAWKNNRQDSYLMAMSAPDFGAPVSDAARKRFVKQDSYVQAMQEDDLLSPQLEKKEKRPNYDNIISKLDISREDSKAPANFCDKKTPRILRQPSYEQAIDIDQDFLISSTMARSAKSLKKTRRQDSYLEAIQVGADCRSSWASKRQDSYQKALDEDEILAGPANLGKVSGSGGLEERQQEACTTIQATYRGYMSRKAAADRSKAASRIQSAFRGFRSRKQNTFLPSNCCSDAPSKRTPSKCKRFQLQKQQAEFKEAVQEDVPDLRDP